MIQSCIRASKGVILVDGSQSRHLSMKSRKLFCGHCINYDSGFVPGMRSLPRESELSNRGSSVSSSKKIFPLVD